VVLLWLGATALKVVGYDAVHLDGWAFTLAFVLLASALLLVGYLWERLAERAQPTEESIVVVVGAVAFAVASLQPWDTDRARGVGLLCIAAVLTAFAAPVFARLRNLATLLWAPALALAAVAAWLLLDDTLLVLAWTAGAAALTGLAVATKERRLHAASLGYLLLGVAAALVDAPPSQLVSARAHPAHGIVSLLLAIVAVLAFAWGERDPEEDEWRTASLWTAATLAVYTASLGILELAVRVSSAGLHTDFQRGHTAVSALWGALGLTLLYVGLRQRRPALRFGGLALFVISLGKLFLYDLSQLSSITRALSFLAVGAVLLLAGFFTQKLSADGAETRGPAVE
jgi:MFS family permease